MVVADPRQARRFLMKVDPTLAEVIRQVGPCPLAPSRRFDPFVSLARAIAYQQLTGKAAETILRRVVALFPGRAFPSPRQVREAPVPLLRSAGLSGSKVAALKDLAEHVLEGKVPSARALRRLTDEEIIERVTVVRGIGRWTAEMMLIFPMGRPDVLPVHDYGVRKGFSRLYRRRQLVSPAALTSYGERWRPYRSTASWYLWRVLELDGA